MQGFKMLADREGFEPSDTLLHHTLSKRAHSTTLPSVRLENALTGRGGRTLTGGRWRGNAEMSLFLASMLSNLAVTI